jgi:hypothetical protein
MKNNLLSIFIILLIVVSCQSKEEKAAKLIKEDMYRTLYDFSSYEPIETKVDSAFTTIYHDSIILGYAYLSKEYLEKVNESLDKTKEAQSSMEIWSNSYSSFGEYKYKNARNEFNTSLEKAKEYMSEIKVLQNSIKKRTTEFKTTFYGWQAKHKFRCKTKGGNFDLANYIYVFDPKFKKIIYSENVDDEKLVKMKNLIDESLKNDSTSN